MSGLLGAARRLFSGVTATLWQSALDAAGVSADSTRFRLARGAVWSLVGNTGSQVLSLGAAIIVGRMLGEVGYGEFSVITRTVGVLGGLAGLGLGLTATRHIAALRESDPARAIGILRLCRWAALLSGFVMAVAVVATSPLFASRILNAPGLSTDLVIGCGLLFFNTVFGIEIGGLAGFEAFGRLAGVSLARAFLSLALAAVGVWTFGLRGALVGMVAGAALGFLLSWRSLTAEVRSLGFNQETHVGPEDWRVLVRFSLPAFLAGTLVAPVLWLGNIVVVNQPGGYGAIGVFNAAERWRQLLTFLPVVVGQVFMPVLANEFGKGDFAAFKKLLNLNLGIAGVSTTLIALPVYIFARSIMSAFGSQFLGGFTILRILCLATILATTAGVVGAAIAAMGRMWHGLALNCIWALVFIGSAVMFSGRLGRGLAEAYLISYGAHAISVGVYVTYNLRRLQSVEGTQTGGIR